MSWSEVPAINRNGIITQYEVVYEPLETFGGTLAARITTTNATTFTVLLNDLQEFVDYKIRVRAHTSVAEGPFSTSITVQTHEDGMSYKLSSMSKCVLPASRCRPAGGTDYRFSGYFSCCLVLASILIVALPFTVGLNVH